MQSNDDSIHGATPRVSKYIVLRPRVETSASGNFDTPRRLGLPSSQPTTTLPASNEDVALGEVSGSSSQVRF